MNYLNCLTLVVAVGYFFGNAQARIHQLKLEDDNREHITMSTYGFLKNGYLQIDVKKLEFNPLFKLESMKNSFAFILEKTKNNGFNSFSINEEKADYCDRFQRALDKDGSFDRDKFVTSFEAERSNSNAYSLVVFQLDLVRKNIELIRIGPDLKNLRIDTKFNSKNDYGLKQLIQVPTQTVDTVSANATNDDDKKYDASILNSDKFDNTAVINEFIEDRGELKTIEFNVTNSSLAFRFEMVVKKMNDEGLFIFSFFNCLKPSEKDLNLKNIKTSSKTAENFNNNNEAYLADSKEFRNGVNLEIDILERNEDSFLSAGEIPEPTLYLTWSIIYFLAAISWSYILKASKGEVFKIHYLMMALVFVKSISLTFHAINMHYIAVNGTQEAVWAILYYITYVLRGFLLILSILLVGTGFSVIKHILSENERRLFIVVIPLQTLAIIAYIFLEEKEQSTVDYVTWRQIFFILDLFCCGAILIPVVWSIRHLEAASRTDGKMVFNLKKLRIFKHFYIMIIFYIYFTRIIGFLLKQMLPFRYEWFDVLAMEVFTFTFFAMTAYKFQPTSNNAYLRVDDEEEINMNEIEQLLIENDNGHIDENTETILDLIEQDYYVSGLGSDEETRLQPSGPNSKNPTLQSRAKTNFPN